VSTPSTSIFGRIVSGADVEQWCLACVRTWIGTYLSEKERQDEEVVGSLQRPRSYSVAPTFDRWPEDQLPAIVLVSIGLADQPVKYGGAFRARWDMGLACICSARTQGESHAMAQRYMAALRALFIQRPSLDGVASGTVWMGESYDDIDFDETRSLSAGIAQFVVEVDDVTSANAGPITPDKPLDPDTDPWADWPLVETADVEVDVVPVTDSVA